MNMKRLVFFLLLTVIFPVTILISATAVTLRTFYEYTNVLALAIVNGVDYVAKWAQCFCDQD